MSFFRVFISKVMVLYWDVIVLNVLMNPRSCVSCSFIFKILGFVSRSFFGTDIISFLIFLKSVLVIRKNLSTSFSIIIIGCLFEFSYYSNVVKKKEGGYLATDHTLMCFFPLTLLSVTMNGPCMCPCSMCSLWSLIRNFVQGRPCLSVNILFAITEGSVDFVIAV